MQSEELATQVQKDGILQTATKHNDYGQKQKELFCVVDT
jgi:hypothetical protein